MTSRDRLAFFQSVVKDKHGLVEAPLDVEPAKSDRKRFLASLADDTPTIETSRSSGSESVVRFSLAKLREFKGLRISAESFKKQVEHVRKRPNYDSSNRKMFANPTIRISQHGLKIGLWSVSICCCTVVCDDGKLVYVSFRMSLVAKPLRHAENGIDIHRVKALFQSDRCVCDRARCFKQVGMHEKELMQFLHMFWDLEKPARDAFEKPLVDQKQDLSHVHNVVCSISLMCFVEKLGIK